jgi:hypothetical protein
LVPFQRFAVASLPVKDSVQNLYELKYKETKYVPDNHLRFCFFTAWKEAIAPIVCVDFSHYSGNFASSTVERVGTIKRASPNRLSDQPGGATRKVTGPEKTDGSARGSWGSEL